MQSTSGKSAVHKAPQLHTASTASVELSVQELRHRLSMSCKTEQAPVRCPRLAFASGVYPSASPQGQHASHACILQHVQCVKLCHACANIWPMGSVSLRPPLLGPEQPRWDFARPDSDNRSSSGTGCERLLITVCVHGNEPCGLLVNPELQRKQCTRHAPDQMHASSQRTQRLQSGRQRTARRLLPWRRCPESTVTSTRTETLVLHALQAANELLEEGFFDSAAGEGTWPHTWDQLTVLLGNPAGLQAGKRQVDYPHAGDQAIERYRPTPSTLLWRANMHMFRACCHP